MAQALRFVLALVALGATSVPAAAITDHDVRPRIIVDGSTGDFTADEAVFGLTGSGTPEESANDSQWGEFDDVRQVRITWDHRALYVAVEATIWGNNLVLAIDAVDGRGLATMSNLNSWRRIFDFPADFAPDLFGCTWDENTAPRLLVHQGGDIVTDNLPGSIFHGAASFQGAAPDRAMEFRVPWSVVFLGGTRDTVVDFGGIPDTVVLVPPCAALKLAAYVTGGPDGTSGPDSAPNNTGGHPVDFLIPVLIDNFATVSLDLDCDGMADVGASPHDRTAIHDPTTPVHRATWGQVRRRFR